MSGEGQADGMDAQFQLNTFWQKTKEEIVNMTPNDVRQQELPLARIKRIMKLDDEVKMISAEAPALFSKAAEIFIAEMTLRAWVHTEDNKRRTLQKNDIAMAITKYDQFDFLIDIVPRDEIKPSKVREESSRGIPTDQHYYQIAQQFQTVLQQTAAGLTGNNGTNGPQTIQIVQSGGGAQVQNVQATTTSAASSQPQQPQIIQLQPQQQQATTQPPPNGGIQIIQQIVGPDGNIQQIPIQLTPQQLQMIRLQMSGATQQPIVIQTAPIQATVASPQTSGASQPQIIQLQQV